MELIKALPIACQRNRKGKSERVSEMERKTLHSEQERERTAERTWKQRGKEGAKESEMERKTLHGEPERFAGRCTAEGPHREVSSTRGGAGPGARPCR